MIETGAPVGTAIGGHCIKRGRDEGEERAGGGEGASLVHAAPCKAAAVTVPGLCCSACPHMHVLDACLLVQCR
jgi:hypothetical protein